MVAWMQACRLPDSPCAGQICHLADWFPRWRGNERAGAPDLIVEVLSPGTSAKDLRDKKALYERAGVREYLVVDPLEQYAVRFLLGADGYDKGTVFAADEVLRSATLEAVEVPLWEVFEVPGPTGAAPADG